MFKPRNTDRYLMIAINKRNATKKALVLDHEKYGQTKSQNHYNHWCIYCKKTLNIWEQCWKLHEKPLSRELEQKGEQVNHRQTHVIVTQPKDTKPQLTKGLNGEDIESTRSFISSLKNPSSNCSLAYLGKFFLLV